MKFYQSLKEEIVNEIYLFHLQSQVMPCISVYQPVPSSFLSRWKALMLFNDEKPMAGLRRNSEHPSYPVLHSSPVTSIFWTVSRGYSVMPSRKQSKILFSALTM